MNLTELHRGHTHARTRTLGTMKLLLLPVVMAVFAVAQVFCEDNAPKEEADYWTSSNQMQVGGTVSSTIPSIIHKSLSIGVRLIDYECLSLFGWKLAERLLLYKFCLTKVGKTPCWCDGCQFTEVKVQPTRRMHKPLQEQCIWSGNRRIEYISITFAFLYMKWSNDGDDRHMAVRHCRLDVNLLGTLVVF